MSSEELFVGFKQKQEEMRYTILRSDATMSRSGFIDTTNGAFVTSKNALKLARREHEADGIKHHEKAEGDARKTTKLERRALIAAKGAREYYSGRMRLCAALAGKGEEEFLGSVRSSTERRAVARMRTILRKPVFSVQELSTGSHLLPWQQSIVKDMWANMFRFRSTETFGFPKIWPEWLYCESSCEDTAHTFCLKF